MSRLPRPHIPLGVRITVVTSQLFGFGRSPVPRNTSTQREYLDGLLLSLAKIISDDPANPEPLQLDHHPALENREFDRRTGKYKPDANDPDFLYYRTRARHSTKTHVRGENGQRSDTDFRMHQKRLDQNRGKLPRRPKAKIQSRGFQTPTVKREWPNRPFRGGW